MSEGLEALFNEDKSEPAVTPESTGSQPRDEGGRFAATQPVEPTPVVEPVAAAPVVPAAPVTPEPVKAEPGHIPISALLDEREKRQKFERELNELRAQRQQPEASPNLQTPEE